MDSKDEREKRLAEALRANLRRRKAQAREGVPAVIEGVVENGGSPDDKASDDAERETGPLAPPSVVTAEAGTHRCGALSGAVQRLRIGRAEFRQFRRLWVPAFAGTTV